jgi:hypothetical protein
MNIRIAISAVVLLAAASALSAHHTVAQFFDTSKFVTLQGTLTRVEWRQPHVILRVETRSTDGSTTSWNVETRHPQELARTGLGPDSFKVGDSFTAVVCIAKDGTRWAVTHEIPRAGGKAAVGVGGC